MDDRVVVDAATARALVAAQFPRWAGLTVTPVEPGGWNNRTFRLGETMSVRMPSAARYAAEVAKERAVLGRLAGRLPLSIPTPLAIGKPGFGYPFPWSVMGWITGEVAGVGCVSDPVRLASDLAGFLRALHRIDAAGGPAAGAHSFHRGGDLSAYDEEVGGCLRALAGRIEIDAAVEVWRTARASRWRAPPVWVHGDVAPGNLLVRNGRLAAVIDFGACAVGDPACDLVIAWTLFEGQARAAFRDALGLDGGTWARARGWALWKAMLILAGRSNVAPLETSPERVIAAVVSERHQL